MTRDGPAVVKEETVAVVCDSSWKKPERIYEIGELRDGIGEGRSVTF